MEWKTNAGKRAFDYHNSGFHCAEAVSKTIVEIYGKNGKNRYRPNVATAFGGGVGISKQEICGAMVGGLIALGHLFGRSEPGADWANLQKLSEKLRNEFIRSYGTTNCGSLLAKFGPQENMMRCKQLSGEVAELLTKIIKEADRI